MANSIMTNASAMTALKTLNMTNKSLEQTQARIATGYRVAEASDNAAYWSIATTMRSDNKALSTVQDALGVGSATVDTAYTGMNSAISTMDDIKAKLVAAKQPGVDKDKIQTEIAQLQKQLEGQATSASFNGQNWLSVDTSAASWNAGDRNFVSSFNRDMSGSVSVGMTEVNISDVALFDTRSSGTKAGLLDGRTSAFALPAGMDLVSGVRAGDGTDAAAIEIFGDVSSLTLTGDDKISFNLSVDGYSKEITIDKATVNNALGPSANGTIADADAMVTVVTRALADAGFTTANATVSKTNTDGVTITNAGGNTSSFTLAVSDLSAQGGDAYTGIKDIDVSSASDSQLNGFISSVDKMLSNMTDAAANLGAIKGRIEMQKTFASDLMDAIDRGVGQLVDADMNEESTRLQALQVQQQLGVQALSIANSNSQSLLSLFRG